MSVPLFTHIPTEADLMASSRQIDPSIAEQILKYGEEWSGGSQQQQLEVINYLTGMVNSLGKHCWHDIVWTYLMNRIHNLSNQINQNIAAARR